LSVASNVHTRRFGTELVVLDLNSGEYFALDATGARIWEALSSASCVDDVVERVGADYEVSVAQFRADVMALAEELVNRKLMIVLP
jgi:hypothetical protein